jgi:hypothetical protein
MYGLNRESRIFDKIFYALNQILKSDSDSFLYHIQIQNL